MKCVLTTNPTLAFTDAWRMHRHYVGDFRTVSAPHVVIGVEESEQRFIDDALLFYADVIHDSIERAAARSGMMVPRDFHSQSVFCRHEGENVCHIASYAVAFGRN